MPETLDFEPETQSQIDFQPEALNFTPDPPPVFQTETEEALAETPVYNPKNEQIRAAPTFFGELHAGRLGSAYYLAKEAISEQFKGQPIEKGRGAGLLGTDEQISPSPDDSLPIRAAKAFINVSNRTMAGLTGPDMLPLAVIGGGGGAAGKLVAGAFGADIASHAPDTWAAIQAAEETEPFSQERFEAGLDTVLQSLMLHATAGHALKKTTVKPQESPEAPPATTERPVEQTALPGNPAQRMVPIEEIPSEAARVKVDSGIKEADVNAESAAKAANELAQPIPSAQTSLVTKSGNLEIRDPTDSVSDALKSYSGTPAGAVSGMMKMSDISGSITREPRVRELANKMGSGNGYVSRVIIDAGNNIVEGQHRFEALKRLGATEIPVIKIFGTEDLIPDVGRVKKAIKEQGGIHSDQVNQMVSNLGEILMDEKGSVADLGLYDAPRGWEKQWNAAINEVLRQKSEQAPPVPSAPIQDVPPGIPKESEVPTSTNNATTALERPKGESVDPSEARAAEIPAVEPQAVGEIMSPGPGAASAKETLASYELRRFGQRFQETEGISPEIREETSNRYYEPIPNKVTLEDAGKIIDQRGTDEAIRLVRDENFAMEPRVRATLGQTLVQKLNQSHAEATAAGDTARAKSFLDQAVDTAEYLGEFGTRLGQGVQSFAIWSKLTPEGMLESARRSAKRANVELTPEQQAEIRRLSLEAYAAAEGIPKQDATKKLADYMVQQTGIPARDLPLSIYYTHILSGVQTHVVNAVDTGLNVMHEVNNLAVTNPRAAASIYSGLMRGLGEGKYDGLLSLQEGRRIASGKFIESPDLLEVSKFGTKGGVPIADTGKVSRATRRIAESKIATPLNAYKYVMRMMSASDAVFFRGAEEARAGLLAHRLAEATGTERAKLKSEVDSILGYDRLPEFREQSAREGYTGAKAEARATELMIQSRPESLRADAADYAGVSTYNHEPRGVLGYLSNEVAKVSNRYPALKLFVPFTRIVANVTNRGLDNTPLGILRSLKEKGLSKEERQRVLTRGIMGTAGLIGLGVLNATGAIQIHGAGPSDREKKRQLQNAGWKPFSLQVGDKYFTYTYSPIGLGVSVLGNYLDSQRYNELSQKDSLTRVAYSMSRIGQTVFSQSFLSGLSNLFTILSGDPGQSVSSLKQFFSSVATGATTPNLLRDVNHLFDPTARKSENIAQDLIKNIPVARLKLRPTLNAFGEPVEVQRNRFFSSQSDDPAWRLIANKNLRVPVVDQTTFVDSEDGYLYAKTAGERMRQYIVRHLAELNRMSDQQAQDNLSKAARNIFDEARQDIVRHGGQKKKRKR